MIALYTQPPANSTVLCVDELGPVVARTFPPAAGWSRDGHRIKAPLEYSRGAEKVWVYGALAPQTGQAHTLTGDSRNSANYIRLLTLLEEAYPSGELYLITDNLSSHNSYKVCTWLSDHPRLHQVFIPIGACWLNLQEAWWRLFRREALAGQTFADGEEIEQATRVATQQLNRHIYPWIWGRPPRPYRELRRRFVYSI